MAISLIEEYIDDLFHYYVFKGDSKQQAIQFLKSLFDSNEKIPKLTYYIVVTPDGNYCRDQYDYYKEVKNIPLKSLVPKIRFEGKKIIEKNSNDLKSIMNILTLIDDQEIILTSRPNFIRICGIEVYIDKSTIKEWVESSCPECKKKSNGFGFKSPDQELTVWQCDFCRKIFVWK